MPFITGVASGFVDGAKAPITPIGFAILTISLSLSSSKTPTDLSLIISINVALVFL